MRVAALDLGKVRVGLAISDELGMLAHPRPAFDGQNRKALLTRISTFAQEEEVDLILVGLPLDADGQEGPAAQRAVSFADQVADATGRRVELWDERLTTIQAHRQLRDGGHDSRSSRKRVDSAAACIILQAWLDGHQEPKG